MSNILWAIIACGAVSILYAAITIKQVMSADGGNARMQEIATAIREGAQAYLSRQYITIAMVGGVIFLAAFYLGWQVAIGFAIGAILPGLAGFIGMHVSVRANVRTAQAAATSLADAQAAAAPQTIAITKLRKPFQTISTPRYF